MGAARINSLLLICVSYIWTQGFPSFSPMWTQIAFSRHDPICHLTWQLLSFVCLSHNPAFLCSYLFFLLLYCVTLEMCLFYRREGRSLPEIHNPLLLSVLTLHFKLLQQLPTFQHLPSLYIHRESEKNPKRTQLCKWHILQPDSLELIKNVTIMLSILCQGKDICIFMQCADPD